MTPLPVETFPELEKLPVLHGFTQRIPGIDCSVERETALERLSQIHDELRTGLRFGNRRYITAQQVHGSNVAVVDKNTVTPVQNVDALITNDRDVCLGIYAADCAPVWLVDPVNHVVGCVHSGRKGTELGVVPATIRRMIAEFNSQPEDLVAQIGPCIRPPQYEVDFAADIQRQCREEGLIGVFDCGTCTATHSDRYYSYRKEMGRTGRMVALIALR